jgi:transposase
VAARARGDKRVNRGALPAHLPGVDVTITPEDTNCPCCRAPMHVIGEETSQRLDVVPAQFRVIVTHRRKYACRACEEAAVQAPAPERLIKGGPLRGRHGHAPSDIVPRCIAHKSRLRSKR